MLEFKDLPRTTTRNTYYALHHTYRHVAWVNREALAEGMSDLFIYGRAMMRIGADAMLTRISPIEFAPSPERR